MKFEKSTVYAGFFKKEVIPITCIRGLSVVRELPLALEDSDVLLATTFFVGVSIGAPKATVSFGTDRVAAAFVAGSGRALHPIAQSSPAKSTVDSSQSATVTGNSNQSATVTGDSNQSATVTGDSNQSATVTGDSNQSATVTGDSNQSATVTGDGFKFLRATTDAFHFAGASNIVRVSRRTQGLSVPGVTEILDPTSGQGMGNGTITEITKPAITQSVFANGTITASLLRIRSIRR